MSFIDLLYYNSSQMFDSWQQASFINVTSGLCLPLTDETDCPCECPGAASCIDNGNGIKLCQPCGCSGSPGCSCTQACSAGSIEIFNSFLPQPICQCQCSDFDHADVSDDGMCQVRRFWLAYILMLESLVLLFSVTVLATTALRAFLDQTASVSAAVSATTAWTLFLVQADAYVLMISRSHADTLRLLCIPFTLDVLRVRKALNQCGKTALVAVNQSKVAGVCHRFVQMDGKGLSVTCLTAVLGRVS